MVCMLRDDSSNQPEDAKLQVVFRVLVVMNIEESVGPGSQGPDPGEQVDHVGTLCTAVVGVSAEVNVVVPVDRTQVRQPVAGQIVHEVLDFLEAKWWIVL